MPFKAAAIQLNCQPDLGYNLNQIRIQLENAANMGAKFAGLPENFAFFGDDAEQRRIAETISTEVEDLLPKWAIEFGMFILGGGYPVPASGGKVFNRSVLINPEGKILCYYDKIHLFDVSISEAEVYSESKITQPGKSQATVADLPGLAKVGMSICYDVRFPELYRLMTNKGVELITVPSAFTQTTGQDHWHTLLRARAIENSSYVIAPAQTGIHGNTKKTYGHSLIVDPWGKVISDAGTETGIIIADIDLNYLQEVRKKLPSLAHRVL